MRRFIVQKRAISQLDTKDEISKFLIEAEMILKSNPSISYFDQEEVEITEDSTIDSPKKSEHSDRNHIYSKETASLRIREVLSQIFNDPKKRNKSLEVKSDFCVKGRPLTANFELCLNKRSRFYLGAQRRSSAVLSEDIDRYDLGHRIFEMKPVTNSRKSASNQDKKNVLTSVKQNKSLLDCSKLDQVLTKRLKISAQNLDICNLNSAFTHRESNCKRKGKILKGICTRPVITRNLKMFHNILIS